MIIDNQGKFIKLIAEEGKRITNENRTFFVEFIYLGKNDSAEHYIEVGKEIWGNFIKDPTLEGKIEDVNNDLVKAKSDTDNKLNIVSEEQIFQDMAIDSTMIALMETVDMVLELIDGILADLGKRPQTMAMSMPMDSDNSNIRTLSAFADTLISMKGGESKMVDFYVTAIQRGLRTLEDVPVRYRKEVEATLAALEK